jgi:hypothetical protein
VGWRWCWGHGDYSLKLVIEILVANDLIIYTLIGQYLRLLEIPKKSLTREGKYPKLIPACEGRNFLSFSCIKKNN